MADSVPTASHRPAAGLAETVVMGSVTAKTAAKSMFQSRPTPSPAPYRLGRSPAVMPSIFPAAVIRCAARLDGRGGRRVRRSA